MSATLYCDAIEETGIKSKQVRRALSRQFSCGYKVAMSATDPAPVVCVHCPGYMYTVDSVDEYGRVTWREHQVRGYEPGWFVYCTLDEYVYGLAELEPEVLDVYIRP